MTAKIKTITPKNSQKFSFHNRNIVDTIIKNSQQGQSIEDADRHPQPSYETEYNIKPIVHPNKPAAIIMGHNKQYQAKSEISIVAGTLGFLVSELNPDNPDSDDPIRVAFPTPTDAAQLILSSMTDYGEYNARSVVSTKADIVVAKAAELVEIKAGGVPYLANGVKNPNIYGEIHLIAGNKEEGKDFELQSMVKGENLVKFLRQLIKFIRNMNSQIREINKDVRDLKRTLVNHTHTSSPTGGPTTPSFELVIDVVPSFINNIMIGTGCSAIEKNYTVLMKNYLNSNSPTKIRSSFNKVN